MAAGITGGREFLLRDSSRVLIRPIMPEDKTRLVDGLGRLSEASRYRRFMAPISHLSDDQLRYLTEVDHHDHVAWVALDPDTEGEPGLGVARYTRLKDEPTAAEAAVAVVDSHHRLGLGTLLLGVLAGSALSNGISTFRAYVLGENRPMLEILYELGATTALEPGGLIRVDVSIPESPDDLPDTPTGRVFKAVAREVLPPLGFARWLN